MSQSHNHHRTCDSQHQYAHLEPIQTPLLLPAPSRARFDGASGERAATIYSLVGSAKLNGLDPEAYLRFVIEQIADYRISELDDILPWSVPEQIAKFDHCATAA